MSDGAVATTIFAVFMAGTVALGLAAVRGRGKQGGLAEWSVGGRSLGAVFIWVLMAGEGYTSFSYLGAAGWGYNYGAPVLYVVAYMSCGYAVGYVVGPMLWAYARRHGLVSISDMVAHRYGRPWLGAGVALLVTVFLLPYIQLQITGMGVVVSTISYGAISLNWAYFIGFAVTTGFVVVSGLRGSAWVSVLKDVLVIGTLAFLVVYVPLHYFDGYGDFLDRVVREKSDWLTLPGSGGSRYGEAWFATTSLLNALTVVIFPTTVAGYLGARSADGLRRNAIWLPAYNVLLFVPMLLGMAALFVVPGLVGAESNLALFKLVVDSLPAWGVGVIGVAAALSSIVPMAVFMLVIGTMWGSSVLSLLPRWRGPRRQKLASQAVVVVAGALALVLTYAAPNTLVRLSLISYEGMAQLVPMLLIGLVWRKLTLAGAVSGLVVGVGIVCALVFSDHDPVFGVNAGIVALAVNLAVALVVSYAGPAGRRDERPDAEVLARDPLGAEGEDGADGADGEGERGVRAAAGP
ncbi:sodium:solute symporter family protein [Streptomyces alfalfae]|uniref:Sodium:solute symporter family protein n=1 Tax=Streptomyces alfalfae TaxID=1642299 RepID=A0A7T4PFS6_9ACTN|nr:sodium:solute symporter family protein [Streptomyces alfalfae]QQC89470.1 sodium:solute symporter family protein [Streptomyces alfalfae]QUI31922.1 sodium:solute symporter family protein [Streptomyces alfalfae]